MRLARVLALVAGALLLAPQAHAVVIDILSEGTAADPNEFNGVGPNVLITPVGAWAAALPAGWVSYDAAGGAAGGVSPSDGTVVIFTQLFTLPFGTNTGSVTVWADDTAQVYVDGLLAFAFNPVQDGACADGPIGCEPGEGGVISLSGLLAGPHALTFHVKQVAGDGYGLLYSGSVESAPVPEPATLMLLGVGLAVLGARFRKRA
jgi:hypothetical protein